MNLLFESYLKNQEHPAQLKDLKYRWQIIDWHRTQDRQSFFEKGQDWFGKPSTNLRHLIKTAKFRLLRRYAFFLTLLLLILLSACGLPTVRGSGNVITESRDVHDFNRVIFGGTGELLLTQSDEESLTVAADDNLMEYIESEVRDGTLFIGLNEASGKEISPSQPIRFRLKVREIVGLDVAGKASAETGDIVTERLAVNVSGASTLNMGSLNAQKLVMHLSGSNQVELTGAGEVGEQEVVISGSGNYRAPGLRSQSADVTINGSGDVTVWATELLGVTVSGNGNVDYYGSPLFTHLNRSGNMNISNLGDP